MARLLPPWAVLMLLAVAGCTQPAPEPTGIDGGTGSVSDTRLTPSEAPQGSPVVLDGALTPLGDGFVVNVTAHNPGPATYGHARYPFESSHQPAWSASLSGPPGDALDYSRPDQYDTSYPMQTGQPMPPSSYVNWTFAGSWSNETGCLHRTACANWWDGNLTLDGERGRAPVGTYTWRFTFTYSTGAAGIVRESLDFVVHIQPDA